mmetsp:Transcript_53323/g.134287  ORF Transcript_53323/g.134287 Transcript_53323/m.134287 type:complete len:207 (+) Transcript_53323:298-918(+)
MPSSARPACRASTASGETPRSSSSPPTTPSRARSSTTGSSTAPTHAAAPHAANRTSAPTPATPGGGSRSWWCRPPCCPSRLGARRGAVGGRTSVWWGCISRWYWPLGGSCGSCARGRRSGSSTRRCPTWICLWTFVMASTPPGCVVIWSRSTSCTSRLSSYTDRQSCCCRCQVASCMATAPTHLAPQRSNERTNHQSRENQVSVRA